MIVTATLGHDTLDGGRAGSIRYADRDVPVVVVSGDLSLTVGFNPDDEAQVDVGRHGCDEDCAPHIGADDGTVQECPVCHVTHGDPCGECGGRGYHRSGCCESDGDGEPDGIPAYAVDAIREIAELVQQADVTGWCAQGYDRAPVAWAIDADGRYEDVADGPEFLTLRRIGGVQQLGPVAL